jgi:hypothetical protein
VSVGSRRPIAAAVVAFVLGACGDSGNGVEPQRYARDVCGAVSGWVNTLVGGAGQLGGGEPSKATFTAFLDDATSSTNQLIGQVREAGIPEVDGGQEFSESLVASLGEVRTAFQEARERAADLPERITDPDEQQAFVEELTRILDDVQNATRQIVQELRQQTPPELDQPLEDEPTCDITVPGA